MAQQTRKAFYLSLYRALIIKLSRGKFNYVRELDTHSKIALKRAFRTVQFMYLGMMTNAPEFSEMTLRRAIFSFVNDLHMKK